MRLLSILAVTTILTVGLNAADLTGVWKGSMETQMGKSDVKITITSSAPLAGRVDFGQFEGTINNAKLDGEKISFDVEIDHGKVAFAGTATSVQMKLNVTGTRGDEYQLTCSRQ